MVARLAESVLDSWRRLIRTRLAGPGHSSVVGKAEQSRTGETLTPQGYVRPPLLETDLILVPKICFSLKPICYGIPPVLKDHFLCRPTLELVSHKQVPLYQKLARNNKARGSAVTVYMCFPSWQTADNVIKIVLWSQNFSLCNAMKTLNHDYDYFKNIWRGHYNVVISFTNLQKL